jgi:hypothetical protein
VTKGTVSVVTFTVTTPVTGESERRADYMEPAFAEYFQALRDSAERFRTAQRQQDIETGNDPESGQFLASNGTTIQWRAAHVTGEFEFINAGNMMRCEPVTEEAVG